MKLLGALLGLVLLFPAEGIAQESWGPWSLLRPLEPAAASEDASKVLDAIGASTESLAANAEGPDFEAELSSPAKARAGARPRWQFLEEVEDDQALIDLALGLPSGQEQQARAFLYRTVQHEGEAPRELVFYCGSDDGLRVWWNGELIHRAQFPRGLCVAEEELRVELQPGVNHLLFEVSQESGAWSFQLLHSQVRLNSERLSLQKKINAAIDSGVDWLLRSQQLDGSWSYKIDEYVGGQTALSLYTLIKSGVGADHPSIRRGLAFLRVSPSVSVYDTSCRMMLLGAIADVEAREELGVHLEQLLDWQSGGFAYPEVPTSVADLSNTQYAALGLTAAAAASRNVPQKNWKALAGYVLDCRREDGGFSYRPGMASTGAMTAAGVATSALCLQAFGSEDRRVQRTAEKLREGIADGLQWLGENLRHDRNPEPAAKNYGNDRWRNYYLYGLERVGAITGTKLLNHRDWYWSGATQLVLEQKDVGNWASAYGEDLPNTCFALLFLQKATQTLTGRSERPSKSSLGDDDAERDVSLRGSRKDGELTLWISSFGKEVLEGFERENERGRGLRVKQVEYFDRFGEEERSAAFAEGDPTQPSGTERWAVRLRLVEPGTHVLLARITLDDGSILETQEIRVLADAVLEPWMIPYAESRGGDPIAAIRKKFERSSVTKPHVAKHAFDGLQATSWLCASNDTERKIELQLSKAVKTKRLLFTVAVPRPTTPNWCGRPTVIELGWNGKRDPVRIELDPDPAQKTIHEFERALPIRNLQVRILELVEGETEKRACGFAEIELQK